MVEGCGLVQTDEGGEYYSRNEQHRGVDRGALLAEQVCGAKGLPISSKVIVTLDS